MERAAFLNHLFSHLRSGVLAIDGKKRIAMVNPSAGAILGIDPAASEGRPCDEVLAPHPELLGFLTNASRISRVLDRIEVPLGRPPHATLGVTASPLPATAGWDGGMVLVFKNLSQVERTEEQAQLRERLMALGQMAAGLAHEMRNPLASIKVTVGLLRKSLAGNRDADQKLRSINSDVQRLNQSVTDCLAFARPIRLDPTYVQINDVLEKVLNQTISLEHTYPFQVIRQLTPDIPKTWVDPQQLEIVFFNLLNNAIDAVRQRHGTIIVSSSVERHSPAGRQELIATIADNGEGIPAERLPKLFMPFFTTKGKGSGLGLANVKKIVDHLRGTIEVSSEPGVGTRFSIRLPVVAMPAEGDAAA
jgi:nitrogen-specific signal transduction histidine kinase